VRRELQSHSTCNCKCKSTKKKPYQNLCPPLGHCQTKKISLLEYQGTRYFQESINFLTLLETSDGSLKKKEKEEEKERKNTQTSQNYI
jgi:hypothetical protein